MYVEFEYSIGTLQAMWGRKLAKNEEEEEQPTEEKIVVTMKRKTLDIIIMALKVYEKVTDERVVKGEISEILKRLSTFANEKKNENT